MTATNTTKKYMDTIGEEGVKTLAEWREWFNEYGNHDDDGFSNFKDWFEYSINRGDLAEVVEELNHKVTSYYHDVIDGQGVLKTEEVTETIYMMKLAENEFSFYCNVSEMNGSGTYKECMEDISMYMARY